MDEERLMTTHELEEDESQLSLRPEKLQEYIGQKSVKENLEIFIQAAKNRHETLDHVLLFGPPGLGKTTLATIIANEMDVNIKYTSGPMIERGGDLAAILSVLEPGDVLFIDEIHRIPRQIEEVLYPAMEDYVLDILVGKDETARSVRVDLVPFTLVGATTRAGDLSAPLRDRFGVVSRLEYYNEADLTLIIKRTADVYDVTIEPDAAIELAKRSRGTPRIANRLFRRVRDFAQVKGDGVVTKEMTQLALAALDVDHLGLDHADHTFLRGMIERFNGGPCGIEAIAASIGEDAQTLEDVYEPYLLQKGFLQRTPRGRVVTQLAYEHLGYDWSD